MILQNMSFDPPLFRGYHVILCVSLISFSFNKSTFLDPVCIICNWDSRLLPSVLKEVSLWENVWKHVTVYRRSWTVSEVFKLQFEDIKLNSDGSPNLFPICLWYCQHNIKDWRKTYISQNKSCHLIIFYIITW